MRFWVIISFTCAAVFLLYGLYTSSLPLVPRLFSSRPSSYLPSAAYVNIIRPDDEDEHWPYRTFITSSATPPFLQIRNTSEPQAEGYIFLAARNRDSDVLKSERPYILEANGDLVYAADSDGVWSKSDFRVQEYQGKPHLTLWRGFLTRGDTPGHGYGEVVFMDAEYETFVVAPNDSSIRLLSDRQHPGIADLHEHEMTPWDTMLVTAYNNTLFNLGPINGPSDGWVADSLFYEVDVPTGEILFSWSALEHIDPRRSHLQRVSYLGDGTEESPYDFFHITSVQAVGRDYFLVNSRHMWATYLVSRADGSIVWRIDGETGGDFGKLPDDGFFRWTHHARAHNVSEDSITLSWLDNHNIEEGDRITPSRGLVLQLSLPPNRTQTPKLLRRTDFPGSQRFHSRGQGSYQLDLQHGNQFLCYGETPVMVEYGADGGVVWQARFGPGEKAQSYRAFKHVWHATPKSWAPRLVLQPNRDAKPSSSSSSHRLGAGMMAVKGFVSWNGATDVEAWEVYAGSKKDGIASVGVAEKKGFETVVEFEIPNKGCAQVAALMKGGEKVRLSNMACL